MDMPRTEPQKLAGAITVWEKALTPAELDAIIACGDRLAQEKASMAQDHASAYRITDIAWMPQTPETAPFYQRLTEIVLTMNARFYRYDLAGLEPMQYTVYHGEQGGHYNWHIDAGEHTRQPRKLSVSVQLSDEADYDGCDLQIYARSQVDQAPRGRGTVIAFPAFALHRVTPISRGTRKSLVCWAFGPEFR